MTVTLEFIGQRLHDMQALLLSLNDNATATNRRLERIEDRLVDRFGESRRVSNQLQAIELRLAELAVRLGGQDERITKLEDAQ